MSRGRRKQAKGKIIAEELVVTNDANKAYSYAFIGDSFANDIKEANKYTQMIKASLDNPSRLIYKHNTKNTLFENINNTASPYNYTYGSNSPYIDIQEIVELCQKAYINVPIFRNTIDILTEFSNTKIYFQGGNKKSRDFFNYWFYKKINGWDLASQFFREWYRSGNVFLYRLDGDVSVEGIKQIATVYGTEDVDLAKTYTLPVKYVIVNPADVKAQGTLNFSQSLYFKALTPYELNSLKNPKTEQEKDFFNSLSPEIQRAIKKGESVILPLDPNKFYSIFCKKQDYEPFACPMFLPVLPDIDLKLGFKKIEKIVSRTVEYVILLIKVGTPEIPNPEGMNAMRELMGHETLGRVLVADGTTDFEFIIPDINKILGPEKYKQVNQDIADGLQNIFFDDQKFSSTSIKISVFMERLKEAQTAFLTYFLNPEIKRIAKELGFKSYPEAVMPQINLQDKVALSRMFTRLAELGILTPSEVIEAIENNKLPDMESSIENQKTFKELREQGLYSPLLSNGLGQAGEGRPEGTKGIPQQETRTASPVGTSKASDEEGKFNFTKLSELCVKAAKIESLANKLIKAKLKTKKQPDQEMVKQICGLVFANETPDSWEEKIKDYVNNPEPIKTDIGEQIDEIVVKYDVSVLLASLLNHCRINEH